jgi:F-type H+/Na+-transporting ATPase subunit beta
MIFWVYEDRPTNRATIHFADCPFCNNGQGIAGARQADNEWHGPFHGYQEADNAARQTGRNEVRKCQARVERGCGRRWT